MKEKNGRKRENIDCKCYKGGKEMRKMERERVVFYVSLDTREKTISKKMGREPVVFYTLRSTRERKRIQRQMLLGKGNMIKR